MYSWAVLGVFEVKESIGNNSEVFRSPEMRVSIYAPPKLLYHIDDRYRIPINETKCRLGVFKVKESIGNIFRPIQLLENKINAMHPPILHFPSCFGGHIQHIKRYSKVFIV